MGRVAPSRLSYARGRPRQAPGDDRRSSGALRGFSPCARLRYPLRPVSRPRAPFDALRYGLRALEEMARAEASVVAPPATDDLVFAPHPLLRAPQARRRGPLAAALLRGPRRRHGLRAPRRRLALALANSPRAAAPSSRPTLAALARGDDDELVVGFPLVSFVQTGQRRTAPLLFWSGARATWRIGRRRLAAAPRRRLGPPSHPHLLVLRAPEPEDDEPAFGLHAGLWRQLLDVDGAGPRGPPAQPEGAASRPWCERRGSPVAPTRPPTEDLDAAPMPPTRAELVALVDAVRARASARLSLQAHPHALAMLLPKGDPTSGLRSELATALLGEPPPEEGPLAVYLGAKPADRPRKRPLWTHGASTPTPRRSRPPSRWRGRSTSWPSADLPAAARPRCCTTSRRRPSWRAPSTTPG
jgi:hypothetical protein